MEERRDAVEKIAFEIRAAGRENQSRTMTRLRVGREDIELSTKVASGRWRRELLPHGLPAFDLLYSPGPEQSSSPPPGGPGIYTIPVRRGQASHGDDYQDIEEVDKKAEISVERSMSEK